MNFNDIRVNSSDAKAIEGHLRECAAMFDPHLSLRVNLPDYSKKLADLSDRFEFWEDNRLVGLIAAYLNAHDRRVGFISSVSVSRDFQGKGLASALLKKCFVHACKKGFQFLQLEVGEFNSKAIHFYSSKGFAFCDSNKNGFLNMKFQLSTNE